MVAALPAISAGVSVVQGLSGLSAKQKAANAQKQQIDIQREQNQLQSLATRQRLFVQQEQSEREYILNDIATASANQQTSFGLQAQGLLASFEAQRQRSNVEQNLLNAEQQNVQARDTLARQAASNAVGASAQRQQSLVAESKQQDQLAGQQQQLEKALTDSERQILARQVVEEGRTTSSVNRDDTARLRTLSNALSIGLDLDKASVESMLQGAKERDITTMMEQLAGSDTEFNAGRVAANLRLARQQADGQLQTLNFNDSQQQQALNTVQNYQQVTAALDKTNRESSMASQRADYELQQRSVAKTGNLVESSLSSQRSLVKGPSFIDYLSTGVNAYAAVSPLISNGGGTPQGAPSFLPPVPGTKQSGGYSSNVGAA